MGLADRFKNHTFRPRLNVGCLMDISTGTYQEGKDGEMILNGGHPNSVGIGGMPNTFKSQLAHALNLIVTERYKPDVSIIYDTEDSLTEARIKHLAAKLTGMDVDTLFCDDNARMSLSDNTISGNKFWEEIKTYVKEKADTKAADKRLSPFLDKAGKPQKVNCPTYMEIDSLSQLTTDGLEDMYDKNEVGSSGMNMEAANGARFKSQLFSQMPSLTSRGTIYSTLTAHVGKEVKLDPYAPAGKTLSFMPTGMKFKRVPENFSFLTNITYYASNPQIMSHKDKTCEYPYSTKDTRVGDVDLQRVTIVPWRAKSGATGSPFELVFSQRDGLRVGLSELNHLRSTHNRSVGKHKYKFGYGCIGSDVREFALELLPEMKLTRTTVRRLLDESAALARAMTITSEMQQLFSLWEMEEKYICTPAELRNDLIAKGYDWDILLNTRGYWVFQDQVSEELPFLSTFDLLRMRLDEYKPKWYKK